MSTTYMADKQAASKFKCEICSNQKIQVGIFIAGATCEHRNLAELVPINQRQLIMKLRKSIVYI